MVLFVRGDNMKKTLIVFVAIFGLLILSSCVEQPEEEKEEEIITLSLCEETFENKIISFCDDFDTNGENHFQGIDLSKWAFQEGDGSQYGIPGWGNNEAQFYRKENAFTENGYLHIQALNENFGGKNYTSSRLYTNTLFSQTYGRFEARIKLPLGSGFWPAFWLLPDNVDYGTWAASGEIDIMEAKGRLPFESSGAIHYGGQWPRNTYSYETYTFPEGQSIDQFHVYAIEWTEDKIQWYVNDVLFYETREWFSENGEYPAPFDTNFYLILNLAIGGVFDGGALPSAYLFEEDIYMLVDYVRVFQYFV